GPNVLIRTSYGYAPQWPARARLDPGCVTAFRKTCRWRSSRWGPAGPVLSIGNIFDQRLAWLTTVAGGMGGRAYGPFQWSDGCPNRARGDRGTRDHGKQH